MIKNNHRRKVIISKSAYEGIVLLGIEPYQLEGYGTIIGKIYTNYLYRIKKIIPIQAVLYRRFKEVEIIDYREERLKEIEKDFNNEILGDIHSHTDYQGIKLKKGLSQGDKQFLKKYPKTISLLVSLEKTNHICSWKLENKTIISWHEIKSEEIKLKATVKGYYYEPKRKRVLMTDIIPTKDLEEMLR